MMARYLLTHSLLASWLYAMKETPYADATNEHDALTEFMVSLRREQTPTTEAMQKGIGFEDLVTAILRGSQDVSEYPSKWYDAAQEVAESIRGGVLQFRAKKEIEVSGIPFLLYGRLDVLKAGEIYDIKFSANYERGKYIESTQHPTYLELIPQARAFTYIISNGSAVWRETYRRDETRDIRIFIADFVAWLKNNSLLDTYKEHWLAK